MQSPQLVEHRHHKQRIQQLDLVLQLEYILETSKYLQVLRKWQIGRILPNRVQEPSLQQLEILHVDAPGQLLVIVRKQGYRKWPQLEIVLPHPVPIHIAEPSVVSILVLVQAYRVDEGT